MSELDLAGAEQKVSPPPTPKKKSWHILGWLAIGLGLFLSYLRAWGWSYGMMGPEAWGYMMGGTILPALIAYAIAGRKSVRNFNRFGIWFSGLTLLFMVVSGGHSVSLKDRIANLTKEAAGTKSVSRGGPEADRVIREVMSLFFEDRKAFDRDSSAFVPEISKLYSAESFASAAAMQKSMDSVRGIVLVDQQYSRKIESLPDRAQAIVEQSHWSDRDKRDFMQGVRESFGNQKVLQIRRQAVEVETQWEEATLALYQFAVANAAKIRTDGKSVVLANKSLVTEFSNRMDKATKLRDQLVDLNAKMEAAQKTALAGAGLTKADLGINENETSNKK